jgi:hypothetical protein
MVRRVWEPSFRSTGVQVRTWPTSADLRGAPKSSAIKMYCGRVSRAAAIAVFDPKRTYGDRTLADPLALGLFTRLCPTGGP